MFKNAKLRNKLLLAFFLVTCISTFSTTIFAIYFFSEKIKSEALRNMRNDIQVTQFLFNQKIVRIRDISHFLSNDGNLLSLVYFTVTEKLRTFLEEMVKRENVYHIAVIDKKYRVLGQAHLSGLNVLDEHTDFKKHSLVKKAFHTQTTVAATELIQTAEGDIVSISSVSPIFNKTLSREIIGVVLVRYILNDNPELIDEIQQLLTVTAAIFLHNQAISFKTIATPQIAENIYQRLVNELPNYEDMDIRQNGQLTQYRTLYDIDNRPVAVLGISVPADKYVATTYQAISTLLFIMLVCILAAYTLGVFLAESILFPINRLIKGVKQITSGDVSYKINLNLKNELGILADAFNSMARQLNEWFTIFKNTIDTLTRVGTALSAEKNLDRLLEMLVLEACSITNADGGILHTLEENNYLYLKILYNQSLNVLMHDTADKSFNFAPILLSNPEARIFTHAIINKEIIYTPDVYQSQKFDFSVVKHYDTTIGYRTVAMLVVPLLGRMSNAVGMLQLINPIDSGRGEPPRFTSNQIEIVHSLASQAAVAIENARTYEKIEKKNKAFERFVPIEFLQHLGRAELEEISLGDASQEIMSVLFSDIRSFTTLSETMTPKENFNFLNDYLNFIAPNIIRNGGFIDKFIGDAIMALFSGSQVGVADDAVAAAVNMLDKLKDFNAYLQSHQREPVAIGVGIHTGALTLGTIGFESRMDSTVIGDTVNLASRIEGLTKQYGISIGITSATFRQLKNLQDLLVREIDTVQVKGKETAITVYEIFNGDPEPLKEQKIRILSRYQQAIMLYKEHHWNDALRLFSELHTQIENDKVIKIYVERCYSFKQHPPQEWYGIMRLDEK